MTGAYPPPSINPLSFLYKQTLKLIQMNSFRILSVVVLTFLSSAVFAQAKTDKIKVSGNCGMCKKNIETALKIPGVKTAVWDKTSKVLTVNYDSTKVTNDQVQQKVAAAGYDTPKFKAPKEAYEKLDDCCQYDRTGKVSKAETH
jgi:mercuric ion binding protein